MLLLTISDAAGVGIRVVDAATVEDAVEQIRAIHATGEGFGGDAVVGVVVPQALATITPGSPPTITVTGAAANQKAMRDKAEQALTANATYLGLASPTNAQTLAQVQRLTRETSAVIRLLLGLTDTTEGT